MRREVALLMKAQVTLTSAEAKRLVARAVAAHPKVKRALKEGIVAIGLGTTNAYVIEELLGERVEKGRYLAGFVDAHGTCVVPKAMRLKEVVLERGRRVKESIDAVVKRMKPGDVLIKGANAVDARGIAGVMLASDVGGTIASIYGIAKARGIDIIIPVTLEKLVPGSLDEVSKEAGISVISRSTGIPVGIFPVAGEVITEIEAFKMLFGVEACVLGAGGLGGGEGSRTFLLKGKDDKVEEAFRTVKAIKGESAVTPARGKCSECEYSQCPRAGR
jgi:hypothetical protein